MNKTILVLLSFLTLTTNLFCQVTIHEKHEEESSGTEVSTYKSSSSSTFKLKLDFEESILVGSGMLFAEKSFSDLFGIEVGAGITYYSIINYSMFQSGTFGSGSNSSSVGFFFGSPKETNVAGIAPEDVTLFKSSDISAKPGFAISVCPKIYLEEDPTEGYYFGLNAVFKNYNFETPSVESSNMISQSFNKFNLSAIVGNAWNLSDHFILENHMGVGVSFVDDARNGSYYDGSRARDIKVTFSPTRFHYQVGSRLTFVF